MKKLQLGRNSKTTIVDGATHYVRTLPQGMPVFPSVEGVKNFLEYDNEFPLGFKEDNPAERRLHRQIIKDVKEELEAAQRRGK